MGSVSLLFAMCVNVWWYIHRQTHQLHTNTCTYSYTALSLFLCDAFAGKLDFPPINLEYQYGFLTLKFRNPMHLYENTLALKYLKDNTYPNLETSELSYNVIDQVGLTMGLLHERF